MLLCRFTSIVYKSILQIKYASTKYTEFYFDLNLGNIFPKRFFLPLHDIVLKSFDKKKIK